AAPISVIGPAGPALAGLESAGPGSAGLLAPAAPAGFAKRTGSAPAAPSFSVNLPPRAAASPAASAADRPAVAAAAARLAPAGGAPVLPAWPALLRSPSGAGQEKRNCALFQTGFFRDPVPGRRDLRDRAPRLRRHRLRCRMPPECLGK